MERKTIDFLGEKIGWSDIEARYGKLENPMAEEVMMEHLMFILVSLETGEELKNQRDQAQSDLNSLWAKIQEASEDDQS